MQDLKVKSKTNLLQCISPLGYWRFFIFATFPIQISELVLIISHLTLEMKFSFAGDCKAEFRSREDATFLLGCKSKMRISEAVYSLLISVSFLMGGYSLFPKKGGGCVVNSFCGIFIMAKILLLIFGALLKAIKQLQLRPRRQCLPYMHPHICACFLKSEL